jgi:NAD-dependent deacetylase
MLRDSQIEPATEHANKADVVIVLGSTLLVTPAADLCEPKSGQQLIICNRQTTPLDNDAAVRVFGDCDTFLDLLLLKLMGNNADVYEAWKQGRGARMVEYNKVKGQKK